MRSFITSILVVFIFFAGLQAQELQCNVSVNYAQIQGTNTEVFETLRTTINEFMNSTTWTNDVFDVKERIECNILLKLNEQTGSTYSGSLQIQSRRPVFNSSYSTVMFNYIDNNVIFTYNEYDPIEYNESSFTSNLAGLLAYYAFIVIGIDYDSFSPRGGQPYFMLAERIVNNAQNANEGGWKAFESKRKDNRYWLVNSLLDESYSSVRDFYYNYHRTGLDKMYDKTAMVRGEMVAYLEDLRDVHRRRPDPYMHLLTVVLDAKEDEIVNVFSEGTADEKKRAYEMLIEISPSKSDKYKKINSGS